MRRVRIHQTRFVAIAIVCFGFPTANAQPFPARLQVSELDGTRGFVMRGVHERDECGKAVAAAGDLNHDGIGDLVVGAPLARRNGRNMIGETYVVFGSGSFEPHLNLELLDGINGFTMLGAHFGDFSGMAVSPAGDPNVDGIDDVLVGAGIASPTGIIEAGEAYVLFGSANAFPAKIALGDLDGRLGFDVEGLAPPDRMGAALSHAGDLNHDGIDDIVFGALGASPDGRSFAGETYVVFGTHELETASLADLDGANGFVIQGVLEGDRSGAAVQAAGDVNGDGVDDLVLGGPFHSQLDAARVGQSYVVFGSTDPFPSVLHLGTLDGSNGFVVDGIQAGDLCGSAVAGAGDINGDGFDDVIFGCPNASRADSKRGEVLIVFGRGDGFPARLGPEYYDGVRGFRMMGAETGNFGHSVSGIGDLNDDGIDDFVVGAPSVSPAERSGAGSVYVFFGRREGFSADMESSDADGMNGFRIDGANAGDRMGWSVARAGDVNGDAMPDLIVGAPSVSPDGRQRVGESYLIFGRSATRVPVLLHGLSATRIEAGVQLSWELGAGVGRSWTALVQRASSADAAFTNLHVAELANATSMRYLDRVASPDATWYRIALVDERGEMRAAIRIQVTRSTAQRRTVLHAPRVDPGSGEVEVGYAIAGAASDVRLDVFDARGRRVHAFPRVPNAAGEHIVHWNRADREQSTGVFWLVLRTGNAQESRKLILLAHE